MCEEQKVKSQEYSLKIKKNNNHSGPLIIRLPCDIRKFRKECFHAKFGVSPKANDKYVITHTDDDNEITDICDSNGIKWLLMLLQKFEKPIILNVNVEDESNVPYFTFFFYLFFLSFFFVFFLSCFIVFHKILTF